MPHVRPAPPAGAVPGTVLCLWRAPGSKHLLHAGTDLVFCSVHGHRRLCASLALNQEEGAGCHVTVPVDTRRAEGRAHCQWLTGDPDQPCPAKAVSRVDLLHMRCLQALDALQAGCTQRGVAIVLFGPEAVAARWYTDSELRAQVRHILARARALVNGGYLRLAGVSPACAEER